MQRSLNDLIGAAIGATDGEFGKLTDLYFDDKGWILRYAVVDTNKWLPGGKVLLSLESFGMPNREGDVFSVNLTQQQVKEAPSLGEDHPVSRQQEAKMLKHLNIPPFRSGGDFLPDDKVAEQHAGTGAIQPTAGAIQENMEYDPHLKSLNEIKDYHLRGGTEDLGDVHDLVVQDNGWTVEYIIADTGKLLKSRRIALETSCVVKVDWEASEIAVDFDKKSIDELAEYTGLESLPEPRRK